MARLIVSLIIFLSSLVSFGSLNSDKDLPVDGQPVTLKILTYNVKNCVGLDDVADYNRIADVLRRINADVVAIQELDSATYRSKRVVVLNELAERTNMHASYSASIEYRGGKYGIGILTKENPVSYRKVSLPGKEEKRSLLLVELKEYVIGCVHLSLTGEDRLASIDLINEASKIYAKPVFLAGDLNTAPETVEMYKLEQNWTVLNNLREMTFPANSPNRCIDYILVRKDENYQIDLLDSKVEAESVASDHRPLWVKITLQKKSQPKPTTGN